MKPYLDLTEIVARRMLAKAEPTHRAQEADKAEAYLRSLARIPNEQVVDLQSLTQEELTAKVDALTKARMELMRGFTNQLIYGTAP